MSVAIVSVRRRLALVVPLVLAGCGPVVAFEEPIRVAIWEAGRVCEARIHGGVRIREIDNYRRLRYVYRWPNEGPAFQECFEAEVSKRLPPRDP